MHEWLFVSPIFFGQCRAQKNRIHRRHGRRAFALYFSFPHVRPLPKVLSGNLLESPVTEQTKGTKRRSDLASLADHISRQDSIL